MPSDSSLAMVAKAAAALAAGGPLSSESLSEAIGVFRQISAIPASPQPQINSTKRTSARGSGIPPATKRTTSMALAALPSEATGRGRKAWSWQDVDIGPRPATASTPAKAPSPVPAELDIEADQDGALRRVARILETTPIRLTDSAAMTLSKATGKAIGRDLVRKLALLDGGRLQMTFGFKFGSAVYIGEVDPATAPGKAALHQLVECARLTAAAVPAARRRGRPPKLQDAV